MSIDRCATCSCPVDTDEEPEAYGPDGDDECRCASCREELWEGQLEDWRLDDPRRR